MARVVNSRGCNQKQHMRVWVGYRENSDDVMYIQIKSGSFETKPQMGLSFSFFELVGIYRKVFTFYCRN